MKIIAHRGYWLEQSEKNTLIAFERAMKYGYGFETDYRDYCGKIVIAHDVPEGKEPTAEEIFSLYQKIRYESAIGYKCESRWFTDKAFGLTENV